MRDYWHHSWRVRRRRRRRIRRLSRYLRPRLHRESCPRHLCLSYHLRNQYLNLPTKMASDCGECTRSRSGTTLRERRRRSSVYRGTMRGNKGGCGTRGGGGTRRGRSVTSESTCRLIIILMMMILGKLQPNRINKNTKKGENTV